MRDQIWAPQHDRTRSLGWLALSWLDRFAVHGPGDIEGEPLSRMPLDDEFAGIVLDAYALDSHGRRLYDSAFISRAKGRAKSELAGLMALWEGFGAPRFGGWAKGGEVYRFRDFEYTYSPGEPMGRAVTYPFIRCMATEETQSGNTYDNVYFNLVNGPLSEGLPVGCAGLTRVNLPHGGEIVPSTASNASKDGGKETFVVFDESHLYTKPELIRMYRTVRRNMAKRKDAEPWSLETSTMYLPGENSVAEETHKLAKLIESGKTKRARLLFDHRQGPEEVDLSDEVALTEALREAYGPFADVMDLRRIIDEILDPRNPPGESRRYFLNQPTSAIDSFTTEPELARCVRPGEGLKPGDVIALGFDGSRGKRARGKPDATGLVATRIIDGYQQVLGHWEADEGPGMEDWEPPILEIDATVADAFKTYTVGAFYADPPGWREYVNKWERDFSAKLVKGKAGKQVRVKADHPFEWWMTGFRGELVQRAVEAFGDAISDGDMSYSGDSRMTAHILHARRRVRHGKLTLGKEHDYSSKKIDLCVCAVLSWQARLDALALGIGQKPKAGRVRRIR